MKSAPYAETINYWKTSTLSPDIWIDKAKVELATIGGKVTAEAYAVDGQGKAAFMLQFSIVSDTFQCVWPVLESKGGFTRAAKIQAATLLYHDVKHKVVMAKVKGARIAFVEYLLLAPGVTVTNAVEMPGKLRLMEPTK